MVVANIKMLFPHAKFWPPAKNETLAAAEAALGLTLPRQLCALYRECDGFREDNMEDEYDVVGTKIADVWMAHYLRYDR
ncbi:MAG: hypothetical protein ACREHD_08380 [Pirellulales bacterium]